MDTTTTRSTDAPGASDAVRLHVTVWPLVVHVKPSPLPDTKLTPEGSVVVNTIVPWVEASGPLLVMCAVIGTCEPETVTAVVLLFTLGSAALGSATCKTMLTGVP